MRLRRSYFRVIVVLCTNVRLANGAHGSEPRQLLQRLTLDLANALARDAELFRKVFESERVFIVETEAARDDRTFSFLLFDKSDRTGSQSRGSRRERFEPPVVAAVMAKVDRPNWCSCGFSPQLFDRHPAVDDARMTLHTPVRTTSTMLSTRLEPDYDDEASPFFSRRLGRTTYFLPPGTCMGSSVPVS
jgi:hypothetical protein